VKATFHTLTSNNRENTKAVHLTVTKERQASRLYSFKYQLRDIHKPFYNVKIKTDFRNFKCRKNYTLKSIFASLFYDAFSVTNIYSVDRVTSEWRWTDEDKHPCPKRNSNPRSQLPGDQDLRLKPRSYWDRHRNQVSDTSLQHYYMRYILSRQGTQTSYLSTSYNH
jgi:hypothetical protein